MAAVDANEPILSGFVVSEHVDSPGTYDVVVTYRVVAMDGTAEFTTVAGSEIPADGDMAAALASGLTDFKASLTSRYTFA